MGGGLDPVLSEGAVRALWSAPPVSARWALSRPVLQVVDVRRVPDGSGLRPGPGPSQYRLLLSDGVYAQHATLSRALSPLAKGDDLRRGSVVALRSYVHQPDPDHVRTIFIIKLEILQTECALIGSLKLYKPPRNSVVSSTSRSMSYGLSYGTTSAHNNTRNVGIVQSNLQQPSLNSHQNPRFAVPSMAGGSGAPGNTYGQPAQSFYQRPPPVHICRTPMSNNDASRLLPVAQLNPYQERWTIKARVTSKTDIKQYKNERGSGKVFSFDLLDGQGGEIRATCFNAQADQFFDLIEVDKVYLISKGSLKPAWKKFNSLNHEYEITLDVKTSIEVCVDDDSNILGYGLSSDFNPGFEAIQMGPCGSYPSAGDRNSVVSSTSRSMSYGLSSDFNPGFEAIQMGPSCGSYPSAGDKLSVWKVVGQIKDENLGYSDKPDLITVKATISSVTDLLCHVACPLVVSGMRCNAKVTGDVNGMMHCNRCGYNFSKPCKHGCSVRIQIQDHTGTASATAYECAAEEILGCMAKDLYSMKYEEHDHAQLDDIMLGAVCKQYVFKLKVERQKLSGVKCIVLKAEKVDPSAECRRLLVEINTLLQEGSGPGSEFRSPTMPTNTGS